MKLKMIGVHENKDPVLLTWVHIPPRILKTQGRAVDLRISACSHNP